MVSTGIGIGMRIIDTHCHLDVEEFDSDRDQVIDSCLKAGVDKIVVPAISAPGWDALLSLCARYPQHLFPALGCHPIYIDQHQEQDLALLQNKAQENRPLAIGEIGLDFYIQDLDRSRQQEFFEAQITIANDEDLPIIVHVRKAHDQVISTLKKTRNRGGIIHAFNGSRQQAMQYIDLGFKLGFGGTMTYSHSNKIRKLAKELPMDAIVLETDAPDMTVASHRGERNSPEYLPECLYALAEIRNQPVDQVALATTNNARDILRLP